MPRTMRVEYPGAIYHVLDRGEPDWAGSLKNDPRKLAIAAHLRRATTPPIKWIAARHADGHPHAERGQTGGWFLVVLGP
jgi:hypothetical protein